MAGPVSSPALMTRILFGPTSVSTASNSVCSSAAAGDKVTRLLSNKYNVLLVIKARAVVSAMP